MKSQTNILLIGGSHKLFKYVKTYNNIPEKNISKQKEEKRKKKKEEEKQKQKKKK